MTKPVESNSELGVEVARQENAATQTATVFGWWRQDVPLDVSNRYWRDVHSIMVSRVPGIYQYRLLQLVPNRLGLASEIHGIDLTVPDSDQSHGVAEILFLSEEDQQTFGSSPLNTQYVVRDEQNLCDRNVTRSAIGDNAQTYVDRVGEPTPNGEPRFSSFMLCFSPQQSVSSEQFRHAFVEQIAHPWSQNAAVMRLRLHLLEPYSEKENSPYVSHDCPSAQQYGAWIELMLKEPATLTSLLSSEDIAQFVRAVQIFEISAYYTMVYSGKLTEVGLRGFPAVQTILEAGADLQRQPDLLKALYGSVVHD